MVMKRQVAGMTLKSSRTLQHKQNEIKKNKREAARGFD